VHVVFTFPRQLAPLTLQNKKVVYDLLFRTSAETLLEVARDPKHVGEGRVSDSGVQHAEKANSRQMFGITGNFEQCFCTGSEQEIVDDLLILKSQWG